VQREFVALHRDSYVVPIQVVISKVSGIGEDTVFMAVFEPSPPEQDVANVWLMVGACVCVRTTQA
jgi:hypothetical protein